MRARIQQLENKKLAERYLSTDTRLQGCLKKASTNSTRSKRRGLLPGNLQTTPGRGGTPRRRRHRGSSRCGGRHRGSSAPGLQRRLQRPIRQNSKGNKRCEYLAYPRVLHLATKLICRYQMEMGRLYSGLQDRKYQDKREYARPIED